MSTWHKSTILFTCLIGLAACVPPSLGSSATISTSGGASVPSPVAVQPVPATGLATAQNTVPNRIAIVNPPTAGTRGVPAVLVIPAKEMDAGTYGRIVEDLTIMSRIIEKSVTDAPELLGYSMQDIYGTTSFLRLAGSDRSVLPVLRSFEGRPKSLYLGGYGALLSLSVKFPLVPPPELPKPDKTAQPADQVWAAAQRELADPEGAARARRAGAEGQAYKPEAVEGLKSALIAALKHATNIRDLEPEAWLTILVQGPSAAMEQPQDGSADQRLSLLLGMPATGQSLLTLRAKKADVDQFAKGQFDLTQFQQRVQIVAR